MAITLIATAGANNANTYCSVTDADTYHDSIRVAEYTIWNGLSADVKNRSLVQATRFIDEHWAFIGSRTHPVSGQTQILEWPRKLVPIDGKSGLDREVDPGLLGQMLYYLANDTIPQFLINATSELARQVSQADVSANLEEAGIKRTSVAGLSVEFDSTTALQKGVMNSRMVGMLRKYGDYLPSLNVNMKTAGTMPLLRS